MNSNHRIHRARNVLGDRVEQEASERGMDAQQLARETAKTFDAYLSNYKSAMRTNPDIPPNGHEPDLQEEKAIFETPPEQRNFEQLEWLARKDPQVAYELWEETKEIAESDLDTGWMAGRTIEPLGRSAWERACFLAIRSRLMAAWPPRNPGEMLLIDELAQYEILRRHWVAVLTRLSRDRYMLSSMTKMVDLDHKQTLSMAQATFEASRMVERMQRFYQTTLRSLIRVRKDKSSFKLRLPAPIAVVIERNAERREEEASCDSAI